LLRDAVLAHLDQFVHDTDVAEEAILVEAIEKAGAALRSPSPEPPAQAAKCDCGANDRGSSRFRLHYHLKWCHLKWCATRRVVPREREALIAYTEKWLELADGLTLKQWRHDAGGIIRRLLAALRAPAEAAPDESDCEPPCSSYPHCTCGQ
jgi:hypothetical protein